MRTLSERQRFCGLRFGSAILGGPGELWVAPEARCARRGRESCGIEVGEIRCRLAWRVVWGAQVDERAVAFMTVRNFPPRPVRLRRLLAR